MDWLVKQKLHSCWLRIYQGSPLFSTSKRKQKENRRRCDFSLNRRDLLYLQRLWTRLFMTDLLIYFHFPDRQFSKEINFNIFCPSIPKRYDIFRHICHIIWTLITISIKSGKRFFVIFISLIIFLNCF